MSTFMVHISLAYKENKEHGQERISLIWELQINNSLVIISPVLKCLEGTFLCVHLVLLYKIFKGKSLMTVQEVDFQWHSRAGKTTKLYWQAPHNCNLPYIHGCFHMLLWRHSMISFSTAAIIRNPSSLARVLLSVTLNMPSLILTSVSLGSLSVKYTKLNPRC